MKKFVVVFLSFFISFSYLFTVQSIPPVLPDITREFDITYASGSTLMLLIALPGIVISIFGGLLVQRYGVKRMCVLGLSLVALGSLLSAYSYTFSMLQLARLIIGAGGVLSFVSAPVLIFQWFAQREVGFAMGLQSLSMPLAVVVAFNGLGTFQTIFGWRAVALLNTAIVIVALIASILFIKEGRILGAEKKPDFSRLRNRDIWILSAVWCFFNMGAISYTTWGKTLFTTFRALTPTYSDFLASLFMVGNLINPLSGFLSDRVGKRRPFMMFGALSMAACFLIFPYISKDFFLPTAAYLGLAGAFIPPLVFALPEKILGAGKGALGLGVLGILLNVGIATGPLLIGITLDISKSFEYSFLTMASFMIATALLLLCLKTR